MISVDSDKFFEINVLPNSNYLVTGVVGEGSCFLHAVFTDIYGDQYRQYKGREGGLSVSERREYVSIYRKLLSNSLDLADYLKLVVAKINYDEMYVKIAEKLWSSKKTSLSKDPEKSEQLRKMLMDKFGTPSRFFSETSLSDSFEFVDKFDDPLLNSVIRHLNKYALSQSFAKFKKDVADPSTYTDHTIIELVKTDTKTPNKLGDYNIIIIENGDVRFYGRSETREMLENNKPFILLNYTGNHYESIGRFSEDGDVTRIFNGGDPDILTMLKK